MKDTAIFILFTVFMLSMVAMIISAIYTSNKDPLIEACERKLACSEKCVLVAVPETEVQP